MAMSNDPLRDGLPDRCENEFGARVNVNDRSARPTDAVNFRARSRQPDLPINCFASNRPAAFDFGASNPCARFKSIKASCAAGSRSNRLLNLRKPTFSLSKSRPADLTRFRLLFLKNFLSDFLSSS